MLTITRDIQIEFARFNVGVDAAKRQYYGEEFRHCGCSPVATCNPHRGRAEADLLVATSVEECERLFVILDRPAPTCESPGCNRPQERRTDGQRRLCWTCRKDKK